MNENQFIPVLTVYENFVTVHPENLIPNTEKKQSTHYVDNFEKEKYKGFVSPNTKRKIRKILTTWLESVFTHNRVTKRKEGDDAHWLSFVTLTLPAEQMHEDNYIKRHMLMPYIQKLKRKFDVKYYFWRAEKQKNGNLHFHLIVDKFIDYKELQKNWNDTLNLYGYIEKFREKYHYDNPPSTHVVSIKNVEAPISYLLKYMTKNHADLEAKHLKVQGRVWGCSDELREQKPYRIEADHELISEIDKLADAGAFEKRVSDMVTIYFFNFKALVKKYFKSVYDDMVNYYLSVYQLLYGKHDDEVIVDAPKSKEQKKEKTKTTEQLSLFGNVVKKKRADQHFDN